MLLVGRARVRQVKRGRKALVLSCLSGKQTKVLSSKVVGTIAGARQYQQCASAEAPLHQGPLHGLRRESLVGVQAMEGLGLEGTHWG